MSAFAQQRRVVNIEVQRVQSRKEHSQTYRRRMNFTTRDKMLVEEFVRQTSKVKRRTHHEIVKFKNISRVHDLKYCEI